MAHVPTKRRRKVLFLAAVFCIVSYLSIAGCGSESDDAVFDSPVPDEILGQLDGAEKIIYSDIYDGRLVVFLDENLGARVDSEKSLRSTKGKDEIVSSIHASVEKYPALKFKKSLNMDPDQFESLRKHTKRMTGKTIADFNSIFYIETPDKADAVKILRELRNSAGVVRIYPQMKYVLTDIDTPVPDITGLQGYLDDLNVRAAWNAGATGSNTAVYDGDFEWNFLHEDLDFPYSTSFSGCLPDEAGHPEDPYAECMARSDIAAILPDMAHGTAVAGIVAAKNDGRGITGIAYGTELSPMPGMSGIYEGNMPYLRPGSINIIEFGNFGCLNSDFHMGESAQDNYGHLPIETNPLEFSKIETATALGILVVEGAGNGSINLNNPGVYCARPRDGVDSVHLCAEGCPDSGSLIVGASEGANHKKAFFSNSGSRVDVFSWGQGVTTTSYPLWYESSQNWSSPLPDWLDSEDVNRYYTNRFGGTSAATAIIGGVAALVQSYAKQSMGPPETRDTRFLTPIKMREIIRASAVTRQTPVNFAPYNVFETPGGVHRGAGSCPAGMAGFGFEPGQIADRVCPSDRDLECVKYMGYWTFSPQCIERRCGMSICLSRSSSVSGGCASMGWENETLGGVSYCRPPFGTNDMLNGNIGGQPRLDVAMRRVDDLLESVMDDYPEILSNSPLTPERIVSLWNAGVGIYCRPADLSDNYYLDALHRHPGEGDPMCPEYILWPEGNGIAKPFDFDADGRSDLVQWTNGTWKVDLSTKSRPGDGSDNFGSWDIEIGYPPVNTSSYPIGQWVLSYVEDMNSDGRTDFVVYDRWDGKWYIRFTNTAVLNGGTWNGWDLILDYSSAWHDTLEMDPNLSKVSRPVLGDYNHDNWVDIAIACSDGQWRIDYNGPRDPDSYLFEPDLGEFDVSEEYLTAEQLRRAPGWAYLPAPYYQDGIPAPSNPSTMRPAYKVPDGLADEGRYVWPPPQADSPHIFGGNEVIPLPGGYYHTGAVAIGLKTNDGRWIIVNEEIRDHEWVWSLVTAPEPVDIFGDSSCLPIVGDFDGDLHSDRTVMCPNEWRSAYTSNLFLPDRSPDTARRIPLTYDSNVFTLPGRPHVGGISYAQVRRLIEQYRQFHPASPPPIPVDMP